MIAQDTRPASVSGALRSPTMPAWAPHETVPASVAISRLLKFMEQTPLDPGAMSDNGQNYSWPAGPVDRSGYSDGTPCCSLHANFFIYSAGVSVDELTEDEAALITDAWNKHRRTRAYRAARMLIKLSLYESREALRAGAQWGDHTGKSGTIRNEIRLKNKAFRDRINKIAECHATDFSFLESD